MPVLHVDDDDKIQKLIKETSIPIVIKWSAEWCEPCKRIAPLYEQLSNHPNYEQYVLFLEVDTDKCEEMSDVFKVKSLPTFHFIYKGRQSSLEGSSNPKKLATWLKYHFENAANSE